jgi:hypothetical protein
MSAELAVPGGPLPAEDVARQVAQLRAAREWVRTCSEPEALDAKHKADMVQDWVRAYKAATAIALEACKLQATALRRLGQLNPQLIRGNEQRHAAEWLGGMAEDAFEAMVSSMTEPRSAVSFYREHARREWLGAARRWGEQAARGGQGASEREEAPEIHFHGLALAVQEVLHAAMSGGATTVHDLGEELARHLEITLDHNTSPENVAMREGIEAVIREALRGEQPGSADRARPLIRQGSGHWERAPGLDHLAGPEGSWRRIPWQAAHLSHLQFMAAYRQQQAKDLQASADELSGLAAALERTASTRPGETRITELWKTYQEQAGGVA